MMKGMNLLRLPIDSLTLTHLNDLIENKVSESTTLDFKRDTYGSSDADKRELIKDVSALANTRGGMIIIGIDEVEGCASAIVPFIGDTDAELLRLNAILQSSIEPIITGLEIQTVRNDGNGSIIIIKIPKVGVLPTDPIIREQNGFIEETHQVFMSPTSQN